MPLVAFADSELYKKIEAINIANEIKEEYPEQEFLASCLRVGITIKDLEELTYIEAIKVLYSFLEKNENKERKATQYDIDKLLM